MKKIVFFFVLLVLFSSCDKELVKRPDNLIDKGMMIDVMYDMALLDALKYQDPNSLYANGINPKTYVYKKYKIDSLQFVKSNAYYAADYREYKKMYDDLNGRLKKEKASVDLIIKKEQKKSVAIKNAKVKKVQDSIKKAKKVKEVKIKKEKDSIAKAKKNLKVKK
ncbi:DUF4296 domain-containing protein [Flavobacterium sp. ZT3R18]|uniref:DUF4296 domain-containing protein n=1 Tax=Flavobacterium sp. ZT3R18 TaxID=2594429 RepID=UPI00117B0C74|nr:DUF4296 domain-containing protein [Flavobacterium sp. ZT3R18]TRX38497.1 DUF4296 domain-containing protein [Flavobacterium sp. ZT3R18]